MGVNKIYNVIKAIKPQVKKTGTKEVVEHFSALPSWFTNLWILVCASIFGIKGTQIFRGGGKK